jgi:hypothetical protein
VRRRQELRRRKGKRVRHAITLPDSSQMVEYIISSQCGNCVHTRVYPIEREEDPRGWSTVLITALGSWKKPVPRYHRSLYIYSTIWIDSRKLI